MRMEKVSNRAGKEALEKGEKNKVIFDKTLPKDVNKWRLFFLALFCGWFGLQYEKVGRKKLFYYLLFSFCLFVLFTIFLITNIFSTSIIYEKYWAFLALAMILPSSFGLIIWFFSVLQILTNTFKVPVAIDENIVINDYDIKIAGEILSDVKSNRTENNVKNTSRKKNKVVCKSCGRSVWVFEGEKICPKCDENLEG
ncbi:MAG: hypothetical protein EOM55_02115 [Clostridia bacterium]|nr:hypothetical protein [Clostridia bacterium]